MWCDDICIYVYANRKLILQCFGHKELRIIRMRYAGFLNFVKTIILKYLIPTDRVTEIMFLQTDQSRFDFH